MNAERAKNEGNLFKEIVLTQSLSAFICGHLRLSAFSFLTGNR
jgi:hypothetical protein